MKAANLATQELEMIVASESETGDPYSSLGDWIDAGDLGEMTVDDVIAEWDADR